MPTPTETPTEEPTPTATTTEPAYLGGRAGLAAPLMALPEPAPALAPLVAPLTTTHRVISYTYPSTLLRTGDSLYRLTGAEYSTGEFYHYTYDAVGNRLSLTTTVGVVNYQYDAANRLTSVNGQAYTWDDNGNLLNDGSRTYAYDHANRLTQVVSGTLTTEFVYDGYLPNHIKRANELLSIGNRVRAEVDGQATDYVMDVASPLPQALVATAGGQSSYYLHGVDLIGQYDSGTWAYNVSDALGSVRGLTDPTGQVVNSYSFSPFGVPTGESGGDPYGYTGEWWDASAGLVYLRARMYNPRVGRFLTQDPWQGDPLWPQTLNDYSYVLNNSINATDPSGQVFAHVAVQVWYAFQYGLITEYRIPGTEPAWMPDWVKRRGWWWGSRVDLLDPISFEIYEVESVKTAYAPGHGLDQVGRYIAELNAASAYFVSAWRPGTRATRQMRVLWTPVYDLVAGLEEPGLIVYRFEPNAVRVKILAEITCFSWLARLMYEGVKGLEGLTPEPAMGPPIIIPRFLIDPLYPGWDPWKRPPPVEA